MDENGTQRIVLNCCFGVLDYLNGGKENPKQAGCLIDTEELHTDSYNKSSNN